MNELAVRKSTGADLFPEENRLVDLNDRLKTMEARTRSKLSAASKAEKSGADVKAKNLRDQAKRSRKEYIDYALKRV
jgi:hypothetical protein